MKILHIGTIDAAEGGTAAAVYLFMRGIQRQGCETAIIMPPPGERGHLLGTDVETIYSQSPRYGKFYWIPEITSSIKNAGSIDTIHIHGLWRMIGYQTARYAVMHDIPYVVSPHGMLYPEALARTKAFKRFALSTYEKYVIEHAAVIHVTCAEEAEHIRNLGFKNRMEIIPNAVEIPADSFQKQDYSNFNRIGYLGRFHPRKHIELLIRGFAQFAENDGHKRLILIGDGDSEYLSSLKEEVRKLQIENQVEFTGFLTGAEKYNAIKSLDALVVPSDFENFGIIVVEAMAFGVPVVASKGTPWRILEEERCGCWTDNAPAAIADALARLAALPADERRAMGSRAVALADRLYSVDAVGRQLAELYRSAANR